jgi:osmotically inducible protein OsmC
MSGTDELLVEYRRHDGEHHDILLHSPALKTIGVDFEGIPEDARGGIAVKLLAASLLFCFASTLGAALTARQVNPRRLSGRAVAVKGKDEIRRTKVQAINIEIEVGIDDADAPTLEKCQQIMERGCLISYTLEEAIAIQHTIKRV